MHDEVYIEKKLPNRVDGTLRKFALRVPECIYKCSGIIAVSYTHLTLPTKA